MISRSVLGVVVRDQLTEFEALRDTVLRTALSRILSFGGASAFVVKGVRRCGKSTLLKQLMKKRFPSEFYYFNFDDERVLNFEAVDFQTLMEVLAEAFGPKRTVLFDEIQNIRGWELFVNRLLRQGYKVFITGSNANLLSKELGTHLTGRHVDIELYPFSFAEFLKAKKIEKTTGFYSTEQRALFSKHFSSYFEGGGMPEATLFSDGAILQQVVKDIVHNDILTRYPVRKPADVKIVTNFLLGNVGNLVTYRSLADNFSIKSANTLQKYLGFLEETFLLFSVRKFERKINKLDKNPKKIYCVDNGIVVKNTVSFNEKKGALLENLVAVHLKRLGREFYYYSDQNAECDFVIPGQNLAIQVCYEINFNNLERETKGLAKAMRQAKLRQGLILTFGQENNFKVPKNCSIKPVWQWLLETEK